MTFPTSRNCPSPRWGRWVVTATSARLSSSAVHYTKSCSTLVHFTKSCCTLVSYTKSCCTLVYYTKSCCMLVKHCCLLYKILVHAYIAVLIMKNLRARLLFIKQNLAASLSSSAIHYTCMEIKTKISYVHVHTWIHADNYLMYDINSTNIY